MCCLSEWALESSSSPSLIGNFLILGFWLILTEFDFKNVSKYMSTHASVHFLLFTLNVAYDALLCTLPLSPVSVRSHTAGYRGLPMPLHSTASLRHGLFTQSRIEEHLDWALTLLSPYSFLETFFALSCSTFLSHGFPAAFLTILSFVPFPQLIHWISLSLCPVHLYSHFLPASWGN